MLKKLAAVLLLTGLAGGAALGQQPSASPAASPASQAAAQPAPPKTHLKVGQPAPDFTLSDTEGNKVSLHDFKGKKNLVLAFYVLAFTGG